MALQTHKVLKVWQQSKDLVSEIYKLIATFPKEEIYSLTAQIKRSAISILSNIAEGAASIRLTGRIRYPVTNCKRLGVY